MILSDRPNVAAAHAAATFAYGHELSWWLNPSRFEFHWTRIAHAPHLPSSPSAYHTHHPHPPNSLSLDKSMQFGKVIQVTAPWTRLQTVCTGERPRLWRESNGQVGAGHPGVACDTLPPYG